MRRSLLALLGLLAIAGLADAGPRSRGGGCPGGQCGGFAFGQPAAPYQAQPLTFAAPIAAAPVPVLTWQPAPHPVSQPVYAGVACQGGQCGVPSFGCHGRHHGGRRR